MKFMKRYWNCTVPVAERFMVGSYILYKSCCSLDFPLWNGGSVCSFFLKTCGWMKVHASPQVLSLSLFLSAPCKEIMCRKIVFMQCLLCCWEKRRQSWGPRKRRGRRAQGDGCGGVERCVSPRGPTYLCLSFLPRLEILSLLHSLRQEKKISQGRKHDMGQRFEGDVTLKCAVSQ